MWIDGTELPTEKHTPSPGQGRPVLASAPMPPMGRPDRVRAAARREVVDRPPYAFWRHFPTADRSPAALAQATLRFHDRYGSDLLVVAPPAGYAAQAWGCVEADTPRADGSRPCARCAVARPEDWGAIRALDPAAAPGYAEVVETLVRVGFDRRIGDAPVLVLLPSPSTVAARLGGGRLAAHLREWPGLVGDALASARRDADPLRRALPRGGPGGRPLHGPRPCRARARLRPPMPRCSSPTTTPSWRRSPPDPRCAWWTSPGRCPSRGWRRGPPTSSAGRRAPTCRALADGHARLRGAVLGGLDARALRDEPPAAAVQAAQAAVAAAGGRGLVVGPAGPVWPDTPDEVLAAVVRALGGSTRPILGISR